jgi:simple sugar transport system permease protein
MMLCAAIAGFATVVHTGSDWLGFAAGMAAGALLAAIFGVLVIWLNTNQYATGLALSLFGAASRPLSASATCRPSCPSGPVRLPLLGDIPSRAGAVPPAPAGVWRHRAVLGLIWFLYRTRAGLVLRSVGESPESAHALGYPVRRIRLRPWWRAARCAAWPAPTSPSTPRCGWRAWWPGAAGSRWR